MSDHRRRSALQILLWLLCASIGIVIGKVRIDPRPADGTSAPTDAPTPPPPVHRGPHFDPSTPRLVTAAVGAPAHIPCMARNLGSKSVSWIRHRDLHVLTVNSFTFTNDERFSAHRDPNTGDWVLVLRRPQPSDSGFYECSVSTKPVTAHSVKLNVVIPQVELLGDDKEVYLDRGSTLNLTCVVHFSPQPPEFILWYHRGKLVNYRQRGREMRVETWHLGDTTRSSLLVLNATRRDAGRHACKPSNANKVAITVHVLKSETPAAMQTTNRGVMALLEPSALLGTLAATAGCLITGSTAQFFMPLIIITLATIAVVALVVSVAVITPR